MEDAQLPHRCPKCRALVVDRRSPVCTTLPHRVAERLGDGRPSRSPRPGPSTRRFAREHQASLNTLDPQNDPNLPPIIRFLGFAGPNVEVAIKKSVILSWSKDQFSRPLVVRTTCCPGGRRPQEAREPPARCAHPQSGFFNQPPSRPQSLTQQHIPALHDASESRENRLHREVMHLRSHRAHRILGE